jgi:hypothetical protein
MLEAHAALHFDTVQHLATLYYTFISIISSVRGLFPIFRFVRGRLS